MLLTITTTHRPATDLGYLVGKHPGRVQTRELSFGQAHVFFPEASDERCTLALVLDVDPIALIRNPKGAEGFALGQYTNDRPYVASSFTSVAISRILGRALGGRSRERAELAETPIPLEARLAVVPIRGGEALLRGLFEPLGYAVELDRHPLDGEDPPRFPDWGPSPYATVTLRGTVRLAELLRHLTVLIPVLDDDKHYWVGGDEVDKLLARGEGWLAAHPLREQIALRYLKRRRSLADQALARLTDDHEDERELEARAQAEARDEDRLERPLSLDEQRREAVLEVLRELGAKRVVDLGCGEGKLLRALVRERGFDKVAGMDVAPTALERAKRRLRWDELSPRQRERVDLWQGSLCYRDARVHEFDAAVAVEVIEHVDPSRLDAVAAALFEPRGLACVIVTTPNREYNARFTELPPGKLRHRDHRFEWTRAEFAAWATGVAERYGYQVELRGIGPVDDALGAPTQMGVFRR